MNQQVVEDILLFERGIQDGVRSARKSYMQYKVLWNIAVGICGLTAVFVLFSLVARRRLDGKGYASLALFCCSFLALEFVHERDDVARHCCRLNQVLRNFNIYYSPDTKTLFQLSPFHNKQKKARSPSGKPKSKKDDNKTTIPSSSSSSVSSMPSSSSSIVKFPTQINEHPKSN